MIEQKKKKNRKFNKLVIFSTLIKIDYTYLHHKKKLNTKTCRRVGAQNEELKYLICLYLALFYGQFVLDADFEFGMQ